MSILLHHQIEESNIFNLKIGRGGRAEQWESDALIQEIAEGGYDICRLKLPLHDSHVFEKLDRLGVYYTPFTILAHTQIKITEKDRELHVPDGLTFELYDGSQKEVADKLLRDGLLLETGVNYGTSLYKLLLSGQASIDAAVQYYLGFNHSENPDKTMYLLRNEKEYIGCCCLDHSEEKTDVSLLVTHPDYRHTGHTQLMMQHAMQTAYFQEKKLGGADSALQNLPSLRACLSFGMKLSDSFLNVIAYPFMTVSNLLIGQYPSEEITSSSLMQIIEKYALQNESAIGEDYVFRAKQQHTPDKSTQLSVYVSPIQHTKEGYFIAGKVTDSANQQIHYTFYLKGNDKKYSS